jgi:protein required for attachment to host cells
MQLPEEFHAFAQPTLIVVTDNVHAKIYRAEGRDVELVHTISTKTETLEGEHVEIDTGSGDVRSGEPEDHRRDWSREQLYEKLSEELMRRLKAGEFQSLAMCVPEENANALKESLHVDLLKIAEAWVEKNLTNDDPLDIVLHVQEAE